MYNYKKLTFIMSEQFLYISIEGFGSTCVQKAIQVCDLHLLVLVLQSIPLPKGLMADATRHTIGKVH